jgi:O-Antigen ligase
MPAASHRLDVIALIMLVATVVGSVMAIGAVHPAVLAVVFLLSTATACVVALHRGVGNEAALVLLLLGLAAYTALQALSLPASSIALLDSNNASVFGEALRPWREPGPSRHSLSLDASASWVEVARWITYASVVVLAATTVRAYGWVAAPAVVFASAVLLATTTLGHGILELRSVFGLYAPMHATPRWVSPLLNPNNLAGYLNLGLFCGGSLLASHRTVRFRVPIVLGMAIVLGVSLLSGSRGGTLALVIGCATLAVLYRSRLFRHRAVETWLQIGGIAGAAGALIVVGAPAEAWRAYATTSTKLELFRWVVTMTTDHPWFGVGRGAFETALPPYRGANIAGTTNNVTFAHAENFLLQWAAEWGIPVTLLALAGIGYTFWRWGNRPKASASMLIGVAVLIAQNFVDLGLEVPAVCIALVTVASAFFRPRRRETPTRQLGLPPLALRTVSVACVLAASTGAMALSRLDTVSEARERLVGLYRTTNFKLGGSAQVFDAELRAAVLRRPGEPYFLILGALAARHVKGQEPNRWLSRALERDPTRAETYFVLGRVLAERGFVQQGLDAIKYAVVTEPNLARKVARAALQITRDPELLMRVAPEGAAGCPTLVSIAGRLASQDLRSFLKVASGDARQCDELALQAANVLVTDLEESQAGGCRDTPSCVQSAERALTTAERSVPVAQTRLLRARFLAVTNGNPAGAAFLTGKCASPSEDLECARLVLRLSAKTQTPIAFANAAKELIAASCDDNEACAKAEQFVGDLAIERGDWKVALLHHERAARQGGTKAAWRRYSAVARQAGAQNRAAEAATRANRYDDQGAASGDKSPPTNDDDL